LRTSRILLSITTYSLTLPVCAGGICVFVRDFFCKYVHVNDPFTNSSHCVFWFTIDERLLLQKTLFGVVYIPPDNSTPPSSPYSPARPNF
jgi:hypothetical protein